MDHLVALVKADLIAELSWEVPEEVPLYLLKQLCPAVQQKGEVMLCINMQQGSFSFSDWLQPLLDVWRPSKVAFSSMSQRLILKLTGPCSLEHS